MKRCPTCNRTFTDPNLSFCIEDGTPLAAVTEPPDDPTIVTPSSSTPTYGGNAETQRYQSPDWNPQAYQPPGASAPAPEQRKRRVWPWVLGILAVLFIGVVGLGIAAVVLIPRMMHSASNRNSETNNSNRRVEIGNSNLNSNTNTNANYNSNRTDANENSNAEVTAPPTDHDEVLSTLTDLENEWTVANINADKKKLDRILASDYVGTDASGRALGKADYIKTIERDTVTQKWQFEDLKLSLQSNRATLSGIVTFETKNGDVKYRFTDRFIWRDARWQATGSEISQIK